MDQAEAKVREFILENDPDFVFFQELPGLVPYVETHDLIPANTTSHSGNIATIVRKNLMDELDSKPVGRFAVLTTMPSAGISFANVHLEPGRNGDSKRLSSLKRLITECKTPGLVVVGDTNTRTNEQEQIGPLGLEGKLPPRATWNSRKNLFREGGNKYTAYYTRYFHSKNVNVTSIKVWDRPIKEDAREFFLSDHFAMSGTAKVLKKPN